VQVVIPWGPLPVPQTYRFAEFELDLDAQQLRRDGRPLHLERRPLDLLAMLVQRQGRMVSRDEIIAALWPTRVIIDFDSGLNTLVRKVRHALGDSRDEPRFIETVAGRGYRFVAPVTGPEIPGPASTPPEAPQPVAAKPGWSRNVMLLVAAVLLAGAGIGTWLLRGDDPGQTRIAILPFENLTGDEELGYLASGIAEDTNTSLARIDLSNLRVIGVVSASAVASSGLPVTAIGQQLGVDYVVASSLRRDQNRIRVTSRLLRASDGEQVWSESFDRELTNLLGLQRELSIAIAEQIRQRLSPSVAAAIDARQTRNPQAYELYLKGRYEWTRFQPNSIPRAIQYYQQAVDEDPRYALAWAGMAHALITSPVTVGANRQEVRPAALDALGHALEYGPDLAETQLALGSYYVFLERDLAVAEEAARRAVALDPNSAMCHMFLGIVLVQRDKVVESRAMLRRARELDPLFPLMWANSAVAALTAGEPLEAKEFATQAIAINPEFWVGYLHLGGALTELGDYEGAIEAYANAAKLSGNNSPGATSARAVLLAKTGRGEEARGLLDDLISQSTERHVSPNFIAVIHAALGEYEPALEWLERGVAAGDMYCLPFERDEWPEDLRSDMRFESLQYRCNENWVSKGAD